MQEDNVNPAPADAVGSASFGSKAKPKILGEELVAGDILTCVVSIAPSYRKLAIPVEKFAAVKYKANKEGQPDMKNKLKVTRNALSNDKFEPMVHRFLRGDARMKGQTVSLIPAGRTMEQKIIRKLTTLTEDENNEDVKALKEKMGDLLDEAVGNMTDNATEYDAHMDLAWDEGTEDAAKE